MDTLEDDVMISVLLSTISLKNYLTKSEITIIVACNNFILLCDKLVLVCRNIA